MADIKVELLDWMGDDLRVANAARVSFNKESEWTDKIRDAKWEMTKSLSDKDAKLISYLAKHKHWTPFSHCQATFRIKAPIFVARQLFKHKVGLTENEVSRRYVDDEIEFYEPKVWRKRSPTAKQGSLDEPAWQQGKIDADFKIAAKHCVTAYVSMITRGVCPEQARMVLPQAMMTEWWWTGSLSAFARVYGLRTDPHAQQETRDVAHAIGIHLCNKFPVAWQALCAEKALTDA